MLWYQLFFSKPVIWLNNIRINSLLHKPMASQWRATSNGKRPSILLANAKQQPFLGGGKLVSSANAHLVAAIKTAP